MKRLRKLWHALVIETLAVLALVFAISATTIPSPGQATDEAHGQSENNHAPKIVQLWSNGFGG